MMLGNMRRLGVPSFAVTWLNLPHEAIMNAEPRPDDVAGIGVWSADGVHPVGIVGAARSKTCCGARNHGRTDAIRTELAPPTRNVLLIVHQIQARSATTYRCPGRSVE